MRKYHIELTAYESEMLSQIDLRDDIPNNEDSYAIHLRNKEPLLALLRSLSARNGIPNRRLDTWRDAELQPGRTRGSFRDLFVRNGNVGSEIYTHPHFLRHLRYFLFGAELPDAVIEEFEEAVGNPKWFGGSDILDLSKKTRAIVRKYRLKDYWHAEEFMRLAIDVGLSNSHALSVRNAAKEAARR